MGWGFKSVCGLLAATGAVAEVVVTRSDNGSNHALIIQSGPRDDKPVVTTRKGPGYTVIEQHSSNNRAIIMQGD